MARPIDTLDPHHQVVLERERRLQQRGVDTAAAPGALAPVERGGDAEGEQRRRHVVGDRRSPVVGSSLLILPPVTMRPLRACTTMSMPASAASGPRGPNAVRLPTMSRGWRGGELLVLHAELGGEPRAHVDEHHVGAAEQRVEDLARVAMLEVERQRVLAAVSDDEVPALVRRERRDVPARLALGRLDLDHVGAAVGQHLPGPRDRDELPQLEDRDTVERLLRHV